MMGPMMLGPYGNNQLPPRIQAAFAFLYYARSVSNPQPVGLMQGDMQPDGDELDVDEKGVRQASLDVLRNFINGELTFEDPHCKAPEFDDDEDTREMEMA